MPTRKRSADVSAAFAFTLGAFFLYAGTTGGSLTSSDAVTTFDLTRQMVDRHTMALSGNLLGLESNRGVDGRYYSQFGLGQSVYDIPFYAGGRLITSMMTSPIGKPDTIAKAAVAAGNTVVAALTVGVVWAFALQLSDRALGGAFAATLLAMASLWWPYARFGFNAPLTGFLLTTSTWLAWRAGQAHHAGLAALSGIVMGLLLLTRHEAAVYAIAVALWILAFAPASPADRRRLATAFLPGVAAGGLAWMAYNQARFGSPFNVGYVPEYSAGGYLSLLASLAGYSPTVLLGVAGVVILWRRSPASALLFVLPAIAAVAFFGSLTDWMGGRSYGPRYLVPLLPLMAVAASVVWVRAKLPSRRLLALGLLVGTLWQLPGVLVDYSRVHLDWIRQAHGPGTSGSPAKWSGAIGTSSLALNAQRAVRAVPDNVEYVSGRREPPVVATTGDAGDHDFAQRYSFSLDLWWLYACYLRAIPAWLAVSLGLGFVALAIACFYMGWQRAGAIDASNATRVSGAGSPDLMAPPGAVRSGLR